MHSTIMVMLMYFEGFRSTAYKDQQGAWTIGYGHYLGYDLPEITEVTQAQALATLEEDILAAERDARRIMMEREIRSDRYLQPLIHMVFQLGYTSVTMFSHMLDAMRTDDRSTAAREAMDSTWRQQTPLRAGYVAGLITST